MNPTIFIIGFLLVVASISMFLGGFFLYGISLDMFLIATGISYVLLIGSCFLIWLGVLSEK